MVELLRSLSSLTHTHTHVYADHNVRNILSISIRDRHRIEFMYKPAKFLTYPEKGRLNADEIFLRGVNVDLILLLELTNGSF